MKGLLYIDKNGKPQFSELALSLIPIKELWERDNSNDKSRAYKELAFIILATDLSSNNPFREYSKEDRIAVLKKDILGTNYEIDSVMRNVLTYIKERTRSLAKEHLSDGIEAINKISKYMKSVDLTMTDEVGKPIHNVKQFQEVAQRTAKDVQNLMELKKIVENEDKEESSIRAGGEQELNFD